MHNQLDFFSKSEWSLPSDFRAQLKYDPFKADNLRKGNTYGKYEFKRGDQTKLVPTCECYGLEVVETVNTSDGRANQDHCLPEDVWPNFNAMVTKLQESYVGSLGETFIAQQH